MKKAILTIFFTFFIFFNNTISYASFKNYVLNFKDVDANILNAKELNIIFFHIVDNVSIEKSSEKFILKFQIDSKDVQSNIQILLNDEYFIEMALTDIEKKPILDFIDRSTNDKETISCFKEIIEDDEIPLTKITLSFL
ncbi:MAG: hypothetical protein Q8L85_03885 [Alphaproteobacteria bacterium]|nr:hypothetical protein [Alphaproteobacteria bacterium]